MCFQKRNIVLIIGPFSEVIEGSIEETVHDSHDPGEIFLIEECDHDEEKVDWSIVDHLEDEGLDLVTYVRYRVDFLTHVQLRHTLLVFFCLPDDDLHCLASHIHVVEN